MNQREGKEHGDDMAMADDLQARIMTVRDTVNSARPNILQNIAAQATGGGPFGGRVLARVRSMAKSRPIIGQAMNGTLVSGGSSTPASVQQAVTDSGYRSIPPPSTPTTVLSGGYRLS